MRVLIACEFSGTVRDAFIARGYEAYSCDLLPSETDGPHYQRDVLEILGSRHWDLMIAHPPCTHLCSPGARWWPAKQKEQAESLEFVRALLGAPIRHIALENPVGKISKAIRKPDQIIQPWQFGHGEVKTTCLWLKGLPKLRPTNVVEGREQKCWKASGTMKDRWEFRSRTYAGIAEAMAVQWGGFLEDIARGRVADARRWGSPEAPRREVHES